MPGKPVLIGPFTDGLNNVSVSGEAKDTELVKLVNFEVGTDSSLWSRPPFETVPSSVINPDVVPNNYKVLGIYRASNADWYLIVVVPLAAGAAEVRAYQNADFTVLPTVIKALAVNQNVTAMVQVNDYAYFSVSPTSTISGFKWRTGQATVDLAQMKKGNCMVAYQGRLWIAGIDTATQNSRLYFSTIDTGGINPDLWSATDFLDVAPGEGGFITALLPLNSSILVFKNDGTWRFSYPSSPKAGRVDKVSGSIGASGATSVVEFDNYVYVYDQGRMYELVNNNYTQINRFVQFSLDSESVDGLADGVDLSVVNRRLILRYFNSLFIYSPDSRSWSQWRSYLGTPGKLYELPADSNSTTPSVYIGASTASTQNPSFNLLPAISDTTITYIQSLIGAGNSAKREGTSLVITTGSTTMSKVYLNEKDGATGYNLKVAPGQIFNLTYGALTATPSPGVINGVMTYLKRDGSTSTAILPFTVGAGGTMDFIVPNGAILAHFTIEHATAGKQLTFSWLELKRKAGSAPKSLIKIIDQYNTSPITVEYIDCSMRTKSYDYDTPAALKRLFWWGADIKTTRYVEGKAIPVAVKLPPKWGDLQAYTHLQLQAGTFGNPLSFLKSNLTVVDGGDPANAQTENGRIFVKMKKSLRFRQIAFEMNMSTLGTEATGPCKIHALTSFVLPKEKVVDRFN